MRCSGTPECQAEIHKSDCVFAGAWTPRNPPAFQQAAGSSIRVLPEQIERRARALAGEIHVAGAIPHRFWREAIAEHLQPLAPRSEAERTNRVMREVLLSHLSRLEAEAREQGWS